ncbi:MAG: hypothetical protein LUG84_02155 [Akkermansiaceae bacterium]|nr:hypothetical protein [Akkermansiaceae bacterium]
MKNISFKVFSTGGEWKKTTVLKGGVIAEKEHPDNKPPKKEAQTKRKAHSLRIPVNADWRKTGNLAALQPLSSLSWATSREAPSL